MVKRTILRKNRYLDSVFLMQLARRIAGQPGIRDASALLATEANRMILADLGYGDAGRDPEFAGAGPNDLLLALEGNEAAVEGIAASADAWLSRNPGSNAGVTAGAAPEPRSIAEAVAARPGASVAVISVPGEYAAREARAALQSGLNVFLFSSNVSVEDERQLKAEAGQRGLIVMGPDCGTAHIAGAGIGFANAIRRGPIGVVGGTGTGMQEFSCLVHRAGSGISNGIGTGGRDLSDAIGGISTMVGIDALEADSDTRVIAILSKPPGLHAAAHLAQRLARCAKPVVLCLLGAGPDAMSQFTVPDRSAGAFGDGSLRIASTLDEAAALALQAVGVTHGASASDDSWRAKVLAQTRNLRPEQRYIRGLFAGGTLCYQSLVVFRASGLEVNCNAPLPGMNALPDPWKSHEDTFIDMGAEIFVKGRPHPMIDASLRAKRIEQEAGDPGVALILLDVILGAVSSPDPAGDLLGAIRAAQETTRRRGAGLCVVASVCGTDADAQGLQGQEQALMDAGVLVFPSNVRAAGFCGDVMLQLAGRTGAR